MWQGKELKIGTWDVQRANLTGSRFGFITQKSMKKDWDLGLVTEIDARSEGLREYHRQKRDRFMVHSKKVGVLMNLDEIKKRQTNDWLAGHIEELQKLVEERKEALRVRNEQKRLYNLNQSMRNEQAFNYAVEHLKTVRNRHRRCLRAWENQWWQNMVMECREAQLKSNIGQMYSILARLQLRGTSQNSKSSPCSAKKSLKNTWRLYRRIVSRTPKKRWWLKQ